MEENVRFYWYDVSTPWNMGGVIKIALNFELKPPRKDEKSANCCDNFDCRLHG